MILLTLIFLLINSELVLNASFEDNPIIQAENGHLTIKVPRNKHIYLKTEGQGTIHVNGVDLKNVSLMSSNVANTLSKYKQNFDIALDKIQKLEATVSNNNGIIPTNTSSSTPSLLNENTIRRMNRRLNMLNRKVNLLLLQLTTNECATNPCKNGGTCQDLFNSFHCLCPKEWEGSTCEQDVNECVHFMGTDLGCQNGASCVNRPGSYECSCSHGWFGTHCTRRSSDCNSGSSTELCGHGTCISQNTEAGYKCLCDQGWTTDGKTLPCNTDVNECTASHPACSVDPPVSCINLPGSFVCGACPAGYSGNGYYCSDIDECAIENGGCSTSPKVQCVNTRGSFYCGHCPPGYAGDGKSCVYQGVCNVNNGGCHPLAICRDNSRISSSYVNCICPYGYTGNGIGSTGCIRTGLSTNPCMPNPCRFGTCRPTNTSENYQCLCHGSYSGRNCDRFQSPCASNPCQNGATCIAVLSLFRCMCTTHFTGLRCEEERSSCGGRLVGAQGSIVFPSLEGATYKHSTSCAWTIETNSTQILNVTFTKFDLEASHDCQYDWLQIHDGKNTLSQSLGRFCGKTLPNNGSILTTHNVVYLWFRSDHSVANAGFSLNWTSMEPICGGEISVESHGTIHSPGSPGNYPNNRDCYWKLTAPFGQRFLFHFFTLMIGDDSTCNSDYVEFFSGRDSFGKYCNTSHPPALTSPDFEVSIHFHSNAEKTYPGFQITYSLISAIPGCGGIYSGDEGEIRSPSVNGMYHDNLLCEYKIRVPKSNRIKLRFLSFSIEDSDNCVYDSLSIYSGASKDSGLIARLCGDSLPNEYVLDQNEILIVFKTDPSFNSEGFTLNYEVICGGRFIEPSGSFSSPGYPTLMRSSKRCVYEISQPPATIIKLAVQDLKNGQWSMTYRTMRFIPPSLKVYDGDSENSTLIGAYSKAPPVIISTHNYLWISFASYSMIPNGFMANYTTQKIGCGGILKEKLGTIASPNHPNPYASLSNCQWILSAPPGQVIQISFMMFHLENSHSCAYDYLEIIDNNTESNYGGPLGKFCGHVTPPLLLSTSNLVTVNLVTDSTIGSDGFLATYNFVNESAVCGGNYFTNAGQIKSPSYPNPYPSNIQCTWTITVAAGHQIMLNISDFFLESYSNCRYDWVEIRNGGSSMSPLIGRYCGTTIPKLITSHANKISIIFKSDLTKVERGFKIFWSATSTGCGGTLNAPTGSIISPNYPQPYGANTECIWKISVSAGSSIQLVFSDFEMEEHSLCLLDYLEIFDGPDLGSKSLGKFCTTHPSFLNSTTNHVTVKFRSDISQEGRGFLLQYNTICNRTVRGFGGVIESPNFPNNYPYNLNCNWYIEVNSRNKINITFSHLDLEHQADNYDNKTTSCAFDYVRIEQQPFGNMYADRPPFTTYGSYCGQTLPELIHLNSDMALVRFVTDNLLQGTGFRLEWALDGCGGTLTHPSGSLQSPNYPKTYPSLIECSWLIQVNYGNSIKIEFLEVDIEKDINCNYDQIIVYNGEDDTYPEIAKICHSTKPVTISSSGNFMYVKFKSDHNFEGRGFFANYTSQPSKCGGELTAKKGTITSPNYPQNYDVNDTCSYLIEIEEGHRISLKIEDFDLIGTLSNCTANNSSYVKVFNGPSAAYPVLGKLCGRGVENTTFESTYNHLFLEFVSSTRITAKGFKAKYEQMCGSRIEASGTGEISLSQHDFDNVDNCTWTIIADDPSKHVSLTITYFQTTYSSCEYGETGPLRIFNGETSDAPLIGNYCAGKVPPMITSDGRALHIAIEMYYVNFFATYSVYDSACGGVLMATEGSFSSPGYPNRYPVDAQCEWTLTMPRGLTFKVSFEEFNLLDSEHCNTDYLEIRKVNSTGEMVGVFCGNSIPSNISATSGGFWLMLKTSHVEDGAGVAKAKKGFLANFIFDPVSELFGPRGVIESPFSVYKYSSYLGDYTWKITVAFQKRILLTFKSFMFGSFSDETCYVELQIFDGEDEEHPSLGSLCGNELPDPITTSSNVVFIKTSIFYSSLGSNGNFEIEWLQVDSKANVPISLAKKHNCSSLEPININSLKNYTVISSPGYPYGYANDLNCEWIITTIPMNHLTLDFVALDLDRAYYTMNCVSDYVEIFQKKTDSKDWESISKYCTDNYTTNPIETTNLMKVSFVTNRYSNGTGFSARIWEKCGGSMNDPTGFIIFDNTTTHFGFNYRNKDCEWNVTVRAGKFIQVKFIKFDLLQDRTDKDCNSYVMLRNGNSRNSPLLGDGKFCGNQLPPELKTVGNHLHVKYSGTSGSSFILEYREVGVDCQRQITLTDFASSETINSPNYPNIPNPHSECVWMVMAPPGRTIRIDFIDRFDFDSIKDCAKEYVEIRDGGTVLSKLIGRFCKEKPNSQITTDNIMFVKFFTDIDDASNGFKATVSIAKCGGTVHGKTGEIHSPFFNNPKKYPLDYNCTWRFLAPQDHTIKIKFNSVDLGNSQVCSGDDLLEISEEVREEVQNKGTRLFDSANTVARRLFCGRTLPKNGEIETSTNQAIVHFKSGKDHKNRFKGFSISFNASLETCGGHLVASSGYIQSPRYPNPVQIFRTCFWTITVPKGRRVTLEFLDIDMAQQFSNGLVFHNNVRQKSSLGLSNYYNKPITVKSSDNIMVIFYWSHPNNHRGFKAKFSSDLPTICQGDFNLVEGVLTQPTEILPSFSCTYLRNLYTPGTTLAINVKTLTNVTNLQCSMYLGAVTLLKSDNSQIGSLCTPSEGILRSPFPNNILKVESSFRNQLNFTASYKTYPCGGVKTEEIGTISSPNFPNKYAKDTLECTWLIQLPKEQAIQLTVTDLKLGDDCEKNYLDIYNGNSPEKPKIGRFCKENKPDVIKSENNFLWIDYKYEKQSSSDAEGFSLKYEPMIQGCGGIFHDRKRIIQTPQYPTQYPDNAECLWELHSPQGFHIGLSFTSRFEIEKSDNCTKDFVEIWDWRDGDWFSYGRKCGREIKTFNSTSNKLKILFRSNDRIAGAGFRAQWEWNCGGTFTADATERFIMSPGYPVEYPKNIFCEYNITSPPYKYITVRFDDFYLEESTNCWFDNVTLSSNNARFYNTRKGYCGSNKPPMTRGIGPIRITLKSDHYLSRRGFKFAYQIEDCGGNITKPSVLKSPTLNLPRNNLYTGFFNCLWEIVAPPKKIIKIQFEQFKMAYRRSCHFDNVEVYDGVVQVRSKLLANLCGDLSDNPPSVLSTTNKMLVRSSLDRSNNQEGFKAVVSFVDGPEVGCGGVKQLNSSTPLLFSAPENLRDLDCTWTILAPVDYYIQFNFTELNLPTECDSGKKSNCSCGILEVNDGNLIRNVPFERLCGQQANNLQRDIFSSGNRASIRLFARELKKTAFKVTLSAMTSICGTSSLIPTTNIQTLTSPNFPMNYPPNVRCVWYLRSSRKFQVHFSFMDIEKTEKCDGDRLEFTDTSNYGWINSDSNTVIGFRRNSTDFSAYNSASGIYKFCGNTHNHTFEYYASGYQVEIAFKSFSGRGRGFKLEYHTTECSRNYSALQGRISVNVKEACTIIISVPENRTISVYFQQFLIYKTTDCTNVGMEIKDGDLASSQSLLRHCGYEIPSPVFSTGNKLMINIWSKIVGYQSSFDLLYTSTEDGRGCGGTVFNYKGRVYSPLYPAPYSKSAECVWTVRVTPGLRVALKFEVFEIQGSCTENYVKVTTRTDVASNVQKFCNTDDPATLYSDEWLTISYKSSLNNKGRGFFALFEAVTY